MSWRLARSLDTLRMQVNQRWPKRSKVSDGTIGDEAHASRSSDHNPWIKDGAVGVVSGMDITHDPASGCDSYALAEVLRDGRDPRIKYIISNRRICSSEPTNGKPAWAWRSYTGINPHNHHVHISVKSDKADYDAPQLWNLDAAPRATVNVPDPKPDPLPTLRKGSKGEHVERLQRLLGFVPDKVDGDFGAETKAAVELFQKQRGLLADGVVGPQTWAALSK